MKTILVLLMIWEPMFALKPSDDHIKIKTEWVLMGVVCANPPYKDRNSCHGTQVDYYPGTFKTEAECQRFLKTHKKTIYHKDYTFDPEDCGEFTVDTHDPVGH